jgi:hypothetical protein
MTISRLALMRIPNPCRYGRSSAERANAFRAVCNRAATALSTLLEVLDYAPAVGKDGLKAFRSVEDRYQGMTRLARNVGISNK